MRRAMKGLASLAVIAAVGALAAAGAEAAKAPFSATSGAAPRSASTAVKMADASDTAKSDKTNAKAMASNKLSADAGGTAAGLVKSNSLSSAVAKTSALTKSGELAKLGATRGRGATDKERHHGNLVSSHQIGRHGAMRVAALAPSAMVKGGSVASAVTRSGKVTIRQHSRAHAVGANHKRGRASAALKFGASNARKPSRVSASSKFHAIAAGHHKNFAGTHALKLASAVQPVSPGVKRHRHAPPSGHH
jgi:hypothetical protein